MAQKIRSQYMEKQSNELDELRALDARVKRPANVFAYVFGSISAIIMGCGMSLVMTDIGSKLGMSDSMLAGIAIGVVGLVMALVNCPLFNRILASRKKQYAPQILALSEKITNRR